MYEVDELALNDNVRQRFVQLSLDEDTQHFLDSCFEQSEWLVTQIWHSVAKAFLGMFMTQTSVNGLLSRGRMFVWSEAQARRLLERPRDQTKTARQREWPTEDPTCPADDQQRNEEDRRAELGQPDPQCREALGHADEGAAGERWAGDRMLDLGAGDGHVTQVLAAGALQVDVTEASPVMRYRLRGHGYRVLDTWSWMKEVDDEQYDLVTCLNLLDRCDTPKTLLEDIRTKLASHGALVVALVLPFSPYVEMGTSDNLPSEDLGVTGSTIEEQVNSLATDVFPSLGYRLERWSRLPYLCEGDLDQAFYWLSDVVMVFSKVSDNSDDNDKSSPANKTQEEVEDQYDDALDHIV